MNHFFGAIDKTKVNTGHLKEFGVRINDKEAFDSGKTDINVSNIDKIEDGTWSVLLISSFGIFSLSIFMSIRRMKEFGIRKVLGATVRQIAFLHIGYFLRIAIVAFLIALPGSYWLTRQWLKGFAYKIEPGILLFLIVALILLLVIILSAAYSTLKASRMNPVEAIKIE